VRNLAVFVLSVAAIACGEPTPTEPGPSSSLTVGPGATFTKIQSALDAAPARSTIKVLPGTYGEHVVITKSVTIEGQQAILDGLAGGLDGRYLGFEVKASNVEISGFVVQNFERGIVVDHVSSFRLRNSEIRNNLSKDPPPISAGVTKSDGVVMLQVQDSEITGNFIHDNGSIGLLMNLSSSGNLVQNNRLINNGTQQALQGSGFSGAGIQTTAGNNTRNQILDNEVTGTDWGIALRSAPDSANVVRNNRVHGNRRAGIAVWGQNNRIENNDATGNGLDDRTPSCRLDLIDFDVVDNTWTNNTGSFGAAVPSGPRDVCPGP
jgi:parallel beta-helix repeat protein